MLRTRFRAYFVSLAFVLGTISFIVNRRRYPEMSLGHVLLKATADLGIVGILGLVPVLTPLLVVWSVSWILGMLKGDGPVKSTIGFFLGLILGAVSSYVLEVVLVLGIVSSDLLTGRFLTYFRREKERS